MEILVLYLIIYLKNWKSWYDWIPRFAKIEFITNLIKRGVNVIIPVRKDMDIFKECVKLAKDSNAWEKHS